MAKRKYEVGTFDLRVGRSKTGLGLFSLGAIKKGACVAEYTGRSISEKEQYTSRSKYLFAVTDDIVIDGAVKTNLARYINHSCLPNCEIDIYRGRIYVMARKNIEPGDELTYDYDTEYFEEYIKPYGCRCNKCKPSIQIKKRPMVVSN